MSQVIEIVAKTKSGVVQPFQVIEIISIDGRPYKATGDVEQLQQYVMHMDGRLTALERLLTVSTEGTVQ